MTHRKSAQAVAGLNFREAAELADSRGCSLLVGPDNVVRVIGKKGLKKPGDFTEGLTVIFPLGKGTREISRARIESMTDEAQLRARAPAPQAVSWVETASEIGKPFMDVLGLHRAGTAYGEITPCFSLS